jgi:hypothetical protein
LSIFKYIYYIGYVCQVLLAPLEFRSCYVDQASDVPLDTQNDRNRGQDKNDTISNESKTLVNTKTKFPLRLATPRPADGHKGVERGRETGNSMTINGIIFVIFIISVIPVP